MSCLTNKDLWRFLGANDLCVYINKRDLPQGKDWCAQLEYIFGGCAEVRDGCCLCAIVGEGSSPEKAFDDMVRNYSGRLLVFSHWEQKLDGTSEYKPKEIQFPIILRDDQE